MQLKFRPTQLVHESALPPEAFDLIIVDECHRSIYGQWRAVLEYFDAHIVGQKLVFACATGAMTTAAKLTATQMARLRERMVMDSS